VDYIPYHRVREEYHLSTVCRENGKGTEQGAWGIWDRRLEFVVG